MENKSSVSKLNPLDRPWSTTAEQSSGTTVTGTEIAKLGHFSLMVG